MQCANRDAEEVANQKPKRAAAGDIRSFTTALKIVIPAQAGIQEE
ncbi:MAG: hypothetical protein PHG54_14200 [Smithellaceae bacterium]|nr:hypothetical protein [Smithellaceae bacterium]